MFHARIVPILNTLVRGRALVVGRSSFPLDRRSEPQPDVALLAPLRYQDADRYPTPEVIYAMLEIADSSLAKELGPKLKLYGRIIDVVANVLAGCVRNPNATRANISVTRARGVPIPRRVIGRRAPSGPCRRDRGRTERCSERRTSRPSAA